MRNQKQELNQLCLGTGPDGARGLRKRRAIIGNQPLSLGPVIDAAVRTEPIQARKSGGPHVATRIFQQLVDRD